MPRRTRGRGDSGLEQSQTPVECALEEEAAEEEAAPVFHPRRARQTQTVVRPATRKELRAAAPGGVHVEDLLQRLEFDDGLPGLDAFSALVDESMLLVGSDEGAEAKPRPPGASWCSSFSWTGACRFGEQCWYSHGGRRLRLWEARCRGGSREARPAALSEETAALPLLPSSKRSPMAPMIERSLLSVREEPQLVHAVVFLLFDGLVVWGRDMGRAGAELWSNFLRSWRSGASASTADGREPGASSADLAAIDGNTSSTSAAHPRAEVQWNGDENAWSELPEVVWTRIARCLPIEALAGSFCAALGRCVAWAAVVEERWPDGGGCSRRDWSALDVASLLEASRLAAQLLSWPAPDAGSQPHAGGRERERERLGSSPAVGPGSPPLQAWAGDLDLNAESPAGCNGGGSSSSSVCGAVAAWAAQLGEPAVVRLQARVLPGGLRVDSSLLVLLESGGDVRAVRRTDLKQVCALTVRDAACMDFVGEALVVGTAQPARLQVFDLSVAKPRSPSHSLRLDGNAMASVLDLRMLDPELCFVGIGVPGDVRGALSEALLVRLHDSSGPTIQHRLSTSAAVPLDLRGRLLVNLEASQQDGAVRRHPRLHVWKSSLSCDGGDYSPPPPAFLRLEEEIAEVSARAGAEEAVRSTPRCRTRLAASASGRQVAACRGSRIAMHDARRGGATSSDAGAVVDVRDASRPDRTRDQQWIVRRLFVEGPLLIAIASDLAGDPEAEAAHGTFAWHLPSGRALLTAHALPGHLAAVVGAPACSAESTTSSASSLIFSAMLPSSGGGARFGSSTFSSCIVLPGSAATKVRTGRAAGLAGPVRKIISSSDLRARRSGGMRKR